MTDGHPLAYTAPHAYHHLGCPKYSTRKDRHNNRTFTLQRHISHTHLYDTTAVEGLFSSANDAKQIDLKLDSATETPHHISLDTTVSVTLLPSHIRSTARDGMAPLAHRAAEKIAKHAADVSRAGRTFMAFASDTQGTIGPPSFAAWLRGLFAAYARDLRSRSLDTTASNFALESLLAELLAVLVRDNHRAIERLTIRDRP